MCMSGAMKVLVRRVEFGVGGGFGGCGLIVGAEELVGVGLFFV